jgi:hypothetical protein
MMLPGYQTLLLATRRHDQLFTAAHQVKISRQLMAQCVQDARRFVNNDEALRTYCREARAAFHQAISAPGMIESARG